MIRVLSVLFVSVFIWGCATPTYQSVPLELKSKRDVSLVRSEILNQTSGTLMHINENKDVLYQQNFGGGGAALGILLGPIGVAANMAAIESNTKDDVQALFGKAQVDPNEVFKDMVQQAGFTVVEKSASNPGLTPYVLVSKGENEILYFASAVIAEYQDPAAPKKWVGRYLYQIDTSLPKAALAQGLTDERRAGLRASLRKGFEELLQIYKKDADGSLPGTDITFKSEFVTPRFDYALLGQLLSDEPDRVCIRSYSGVFSLPKKYVTVTKK
jgi:hypothetical protein